jgi:putative phosphoribosyl transferase
VILAVPVGTREALRRLGEVADEIVCLEVPTQDTSVSTFYGTFPQVSDVEVFSALGVSIESRSCASNSGRTIEDIVLDVGSVHLPARLTLVEGASLLVIFAHSSGHGRHSPRNRESAELLHHAGVSTLLLDLLTEGEAVDRRNAFDIHGLADRLMTAVDWAGSSPRTAHLGVAIFGASTGAAAALEVAARRPDVVRSVVSRGGRPDLAEAWLDLVRCPTLLIVGGDDVEVLRLNYVAGQHLLCPSALEIVPGATHLFAEPGALQSAAAAARDWFMDTSVTRVA